MATATTTISGTELMRKIMDGERSLPGTRIPEDKGALAEDKATFDAFNVYMKAQEDLRANPVIAEGADWRGLRAPGIYLEFIKLPKSDLRGADLRGAGLRRADLTESQLQGVNVSGATMIVSSLQRADLTDAVMRGTDLYEAGIAGAVLCRADLTGAYLFRLSFKDTDLTGATVFMAQFYRTDLRGAKGLETVREMATARFHKTGVTDRELRIIESAFRSGSMFDVYAE